MFLERYLFFVNIYLEKPLLMNYHAINYLIMKITYNTFFVKEGFLYGVKNRLMSDRREVLPLSILVQLKQMKN